MYYFKYFIIFYFLVNRSAQDDEILAQIKKATESVSKNSVEQTAYFRALGKVNKLDLDKYRSQVENELNGYAAVEKKGKRDVIFINFTLSHL